MEKHKFNIFPDMQEDDYKRLKADIEINGFDTKQPIYIYEHAILDGWNRQKACNELKIAPTYKDFTGTNIEAINFVMRTNKRRNLTSSQWACIAVDADKIIKVLQAKAKERQIRKPADSVQQLIAEQKQVDNQVDKQLAELFNTNRNYVNEAQKYKDTNPEVFKEVKSGKKTITKARRELKRIEVIENNKRIVEQEIIKPTGKFDVIVIDPAWDIKKIERDITPEQVEFDYPTMTNEEILKIEIPASENCHVFLWTTQKYLPFAFECLKKWNVKYVLTMVWHKNGGFQPFGLPQYNCEFCLYGRIGTPQFINFKQFNTCFNADRTKHSEKPQYFYDLLNRVTGGRKLDMFNRRKIEGFNTFGNEAK